MSKNDHIALSVKNVSKTFKLPHERHSGLKQTIVSKLGGKHRRGYDFQHVLKDISFDVEQGEFFGIVGRNGSGKSTLLKLISGIYAPDQGKVTVNGSLTPFIELGVGFNPELSGRENVFLNGALMGFSRKEMESKYDDIVDFAELPEFMDQKLKNYSSGMQVRLAFAIAIQSNSDILILDEVLAVGDESFQRKCNDYFTNIKNDKTKTIILVTHSMESVKRYCDRAMMIQDGEIVAIGDPEDVSSEYSLENMSSRKDNAKRSGKLVNVSDSISEFKVELLSSARITQDDIVEVAVNYVTNETINTYVAVGINDFDRKIRLFTKIGEVTKSVKDKKNSVRMKFDMSLLNDANIKVMAAVYNDNDEILAFNEERDMPRFQIQRTDSDRNRPTTALIVNDWHKSR